MKIVSSLLFISTLLHAGDLVVKDENVVVEINGINYQLNQNESLKFLDGSTVCYKKGKGRILINNSQQLINKNQACVQTKIINSNSFKKLLSSIKSNIIVLFSDANEKVVDGVTSKDIFGAYNDEVVYINKNKKYMVIKSDLLATLPITLQIKNKDNQLVKTLINGNNTNSFFIINTSDILSGYSLTLIDGLDFTIKNIKIKENI